MVLRLALVSALILATAVVGFFTYYSLRQADLVRCKGLYDSGVNQLGWYLHHSLIMKERGVKTLATTFAPPPGNYSVYWDSHLFEARRLNCQRALIHPVPLLFMPM